MNLQAIDIQKVADAPELWQEIVDASTDGWHWHTWLAHEFNLCAGETYAAQDLSFFVYEDRKAVGVVPLIVQEKRVGDTIEREATYYSGFLPWPCFRHEVQSRETLEDFAFEELERRARKADAHHIRFWLTPPIHRGDELERVTRVATEHKYRYLPLSFHVATVSSQTLAVVRSRYDYKHFSPFFAMTVAEGSGVAGALEESYFKLHTKDAGGQFRSRKSYTKQADIVRGGEGFYVVATHKESGGIAGMALISCYKGAAYYNSVAVDPAFQKLCVGYQLQCKAIEELLNRGIQLYDLGPKEDSSEKKLGIAHFKDKFARHQSRDVYQLEKTFDVNAGN